MLHSGWGWIKSLLDVGWALILDCTRGFVETVTDLININNLPTPTAPPHQHRLHHHQVCMRYSALVTHGSSCTCHTDHGGHASDLGGTRAPHTRPPDTQGRGNRTVKGRPSRSLRVP